MKKFVIGVVAVVLLQVMFTSCEAESQDIQEQVKTHERNAIPPEDYEVPPNG